MQKDLVVIGFPEEKTLVEQIAQELHTNALYASTSFFAAGELQVIAPPSPSSWKETLVVLTTNIEATPISLWRACFLSHLLRAKGAAKIVLLSPWIAYGRQDRVTKDEAPGGLIVGQWLQEAFDRIYTLDAHSQRFIDAFQGKLQNVYGSPLPFSSLKRGTIVVAPDQGAETRATAAATLLHLPVTVLTKTREHQDVVTTLPALPGTKGIDWRTHIPILVDDMTDSGGTLIAAAQTLKEAGAVEILAFVPHVLRGSILRSRAESVITKVEMVFDHEAGSYAEGQLSLLTRQFLSDQADV